jgi:uncharacterized membrane protein
MTSSASGNGSDINLRLREIEARLKRIESRLGITLPVEAEPKPLPQVARMEDMTIASPIQPTPLRTEPPPLPVIGMPSPAAEATSPRVVAPRVQRAEALSRVLQYSTPATAPPNPVKRGSLEQTIGLKWAGWIGAVVLVIGAAFGVKFIYDQRWLAAVPYGVWLALIVFAGFALIGAGEWVYRKVSDIPAASLFGAGVATLFLAAYVGHAYWNLYPPTTAFWLMAATTLIGSAVAMRGRLVSTAVLSLVGGALAPALLGNRGAPIVSFLSYLLTLQLVSLALAWWGAKPKWWVLRGLSLAITVLWTSYVLSTSHRTELAPLIFVLISALVYHAETIVSAIRARASEIEPQQIGASFVTLVTGALTAATLWVTTDSTSNVRAAWVLAFALATGLAAWLLARRGRAIFSALSIAYQIQAVALLALAVPVAFTGVRIEIGWAILAIALAAVGRALDVRVARFGAAVSWALALAHLLISASAPHQSVWLTVLGTDVKSTAVLAWALALVAHVIAALVLPTRDRNDSNARTASITLSQAATLLWFIASLYYLPALGATAWIILYAWLLCAADYVVPELMLGMHMPVLLTAAAVKWVVVDTLMQRLSPNWSATQYMPVLNPSVGAGAMIAGSAIAARWLLRPQSIEKAPRESTGIVLWSITIFLLGWAGSMEIDRAAQLQSMHGQLHWSAWQFEQMAWTMWWAALSSASVFALTRWTNTDTPHRRRALAILCAFVPMLAMKYLFVDTLAFRILAGPRASVGVVLNTQALTAAVVCLSLVVARRLVKRETQIEQIQHIAPVLTALVVLWAGSLEVDRALEQPGALTMFAQPALAKQVALSIFWSTFAIASVVIGFPTRIAGLRYLGLGLFAVTLLKVVAIDMSSVSTGYRILSFIGLGLLMLGTSVLYGKLSPALLRNESPANPLPA